MNADETNTVAPAPSEPLTGKPLTHGQALTPTGPHTCDICGRGFQNPHAMKVHRWRTHTRGGAQATKKIVAYNKLGTRKLGRPKGSVSAPGKHTPAESARLAGLARWGKYVSPKQEERRARKEAKLAAKRLMAEERAAHVQPEPTPVQQIRLPRFCCECGADLQIMFQAYRLAAKLNGW